MKRKNYDITLNGQPVARCHSWNARHKHIVAHVKTLGGEWEMATSSGSRGPEGFTVGTVTWQARDGRVAEFRVERVA